MYTYSHVYIHIYTYSHVYIHIYTYTYTCVQRGICWCRLVPPWAKDQAVLADPVVKGW